MNLTATDQDIAAIKQDIRELTALVPDDGAHGERIRQDIAAASYELDRLTGHSIMELWYSLTVGSAL